MHSDQMHTLHEPELLSQARALLARHRPLFSALEPELGFLFLLAATGAKPLIRLEYEVELELIEAARELQLGSARIERSGSVNGCVHTVFSSDLDLLQQYEVALNGAPWVADDSLVRIEGALLGYPSCCIDAYAQHRALAPTTWGDSGELLLHWPCPNCRETPAILQKHRAIADALAHFATPVS